MSIKTFFQSRITEDENPRSCRARKVVGPDEWHPPTRFEIPHNPSGPVAEQPHLVLREKPCSRLTPARQVGRPARRHPLLVV